MALGDKHRERHFGKVVAILSQKAVLWFLELVHLKVQIESDGTGRYAFASTTST